MKKFRVALLGTASVLCLAMGVAMTNNVNYVANAEETQVTQDFLSATKYKISTDQAESKMLLVTAIRDVADVYEVGYLFTDYTAGEGDIAETTKYYDSLTTGGVTESATEIFGSDWAGAKLIVWEVANTADVTFSAYAKVGERNANGDLTIPEQENKVVGIARNNQKYTVTFVDEYGTTLGTQEVYNGKMPTFADPTKEANEQYTYTFAGWDSVFAPVTGDVTYTANYTETLNKYTITFEDCENLQPMEVDYGTSASKLNDITPTKNGYKFLKWQVRVGGGDYIDVTDEMEVKQDLTVKAVWEKEIVYYDVKYFGYDGAEIDAETVKEGEKLTAPEAPELYKANFDGWYYEGLDVKWNFEQDTVEKETKLYAKYTRTDATATEFESFNSELSLASVKASNNGAVAYSKDEIDGVIGSAKLTLKGGYPEVHVAPRQNLTGYDYISFKLYIPSDDANADRYIVSGGVDYYVGANEWATVTVPVSSIISSIDGNGYANLFMLVNDGYDGDFFATHRSVWEEVVIYLADVAYVKAKAIADNVIVDFADGSAIEVVDALNKNSGATDHMKGALTSKDVAGHTGAKLALAMANKDGYYPQLKIKTAHEKAYYQNLGYTKILVSVYVPAEATGGKFPQMTANGWSDKQLTVGAWNILTYSLDEFFAKYDSTTGLTTLFMIQKGENGFKNLDLYIGEITLLSNFTTVANDGIVWSAYHNQDFNNVLTSDDVGGHSAMAYVESSYMTLGVKLKDSSKNKVFIKLKVLNDNNALDINAIKTTWKNAGWKKVVVRLYIPSENLSDATKQLGTKAIKFTENGTAENIKLDTWVTCEMTIDQFFTSEYGYIEGYDYWTLMCADNQSSSPYYDENCMVYFDSIRLA